MKCRLSSTCTKPVYDSNAWQHQRLGYMPGRSTKERERLLHWLIVGGGPTGVEFAGELVDLVNEDLMRLDPERARDIRITLVEANELLGNFDSRLREYAVDRLHRKAVHLIKAHALLMSLQLLCRAIVMDVELFAKSDLLTCSRCWLSLA